MSTREEQEGISKILCFLHEWDHGNETVRSRILNNFLTQNVGKTYYELEMEFDYGASLFLARITTWMRLTYMFGTRIALQLKSIGVFLSASSNHQYIIEFLEDGGVLTLIDILAQKGIKEEDKAEALLLLQTISNASSKYKEFICESYGVRAVAECLAKSHSEETQDAARALLESLAHRNPKYQNQVYKGLVALMPCTSPKAQQLVLQTIRIVQLELKTAHPNIIEPLLDMLRSLRLEVQDEAIGLILDLSQYELKPALLGGLVALLKPLKKGAQLHQTLEGYMQSKNQTPEDPEMIKMTESLPVFVQQAAAAKALRLLAQSSEDISQELLSLQVVHSLLYTMATREHADAQIQASLALMHFVHTYPVLTEHVRRGMGSTLFLAFMQDPETVHKNIDEIQAEMLLCNKVNTTKDVDVNEVPADS